MDEGRWIVTIALGALGEVYYKLQIWVAGDDFSLEVRNCLLISPHLYEVWILCIEEHLAVVGAKIVVEFTFGLLYSFEGAETLKMSFADIGDEAIIGFGDVDERLYLSRMVCSHLYNSDVMLGTQLQQRLWHTDVVVEVALRIEYVVFF